MTGMRDYPAPVEGLRVEQTDGVLAVRFDRPARRNALTDDIVLALTQIVEVAGSDQSVRVIHLTGEGDHFCSGFDLSLRGDRSAGGPDRASGSEHGLHDTRPASVKRRVGSTQRQMRWHVNRLIPTMLETQVPIVTSVTGWCIGLGMNIALASDFVVAADDARFWSPFTGSGFTPDSGASWIIPRLVGVARAKEMILLGRKISGAQASEWGMIHRAVPAAEVPEVSTALVGELANAATVAVGLAKLLIHRGITADLEPHLADEGFSMELSSRSDDFKEAGRAGREKRPPTFTGT